jgi:crotonobetainyl-CoA:carnitine CoA-transferase CaiB-like acyl-CoA transferase
VTNGENPIGVVASGGEPSGPLHGVKVIDAAVLFAGPAIAAQLADFGADVVKVEHPQGDALRSLGWHKNGVSLWWALVNRNKRCISLDLNLHDGQRLLKELVADADVLIESFRPGTLERWGLGYEELTAINPRLILVRVSGFGQTGPYSSRPGFGTVAEAMSGYAHINGYPDGPPTLPPFALGDGICALFGSIATVMALYYRDVHDRPTGQVIDLSIYEPLFSILGPQAIVFDQLGTIQGRTGNRTDWMAPRNAFQVRDGRWVAVSASSQSIAERLMRLIGHEELIGEAWFGTHTGRLAHHELLDQLIGEWIGDRSMDEVLATFEKFEAAISPIYSIADIFKDPQYIAREAITTVQDDTLGPVRIQNVVPKLSETPGRMRHLGRSLGADNDAVFVGQLGHNAAQVKLWKRQGVIGGSDGPSQHDHTAEADPQSEEQRG